MSERKTLTPSRLDVDDLGKAGWPPPLGDLILDRGEAIAERMRELPAKDMTGAVLAFTNAVQAIARNLQDHVGSLPGALVGGWRRDGLGYVVGLAAAIGPRAAVVDLAGETHAVTGRVLYAEGHPDGYLDARAIASLARRVLDTYAQCYVEDLDWAGWLPALRERLIEGHGFGEAVAEAAITHYFLPF